MVTVKAPATSANLGSGYDVYGMALKKPYDLIKVELSESTDITVDGYNKEIPTDPRKNTAGIVARELTDTDLSIHIDKNIPPGSGLGSSAASAAGTAIAINKLVEKEFSQVELLDAVVSAEKHVSGQAHADNAAPALFGGFCIVNDEVHKIKPPEFDLILLCPEKVNLTKEMRSVVPKKTDIKNVKKNIYYSSLLIKGILEEDLRSFGKGLNDAIVEPKRAKLIDGYKEAKKRAIKEGAIGCTLSGSGPSMIAVGEKPKKIGKAMKKELDTKEINSKLFLTKPGKGSKIISSTD
ncbi:MAG: Homoserine kinase ThrB [Candidatus Methanohalarchaeum thermophilum]|uniref:Homoserine kinase n=1 Tax=Methanohalarchaeum thermophilum TaxID=1903181 RepID=A0A1Q6DT72_METT1|nr:MAG: Homoserine kinase ThrB [Candidatus Methanohalarchaeum thermophilum]